MALRQLVVWVRVLLRQTAQALPQYIVHTLLKGCPQAGARRWIKSAAPDEDQWTRTGRVRGGVGQRKHCAPGLAHERRLCASATRCHERMEVSDVLRNGQRLGSAAALPGLKDPKRVCESTGHGSRAAH